MEQTATSTATTDISVDKIDLYIMKLLSTNCRSSYRTMSSIVRISTNAVKTRVKYLLDKGIIQKFNVVINPAIFGYEKQCFLIVRDLDKLIMKEEKVENYIFHRLNLLGDVLSCAVQLGGESAIFLVLLRPWSEDKIESMITLLQPAIVEYRCAIMNPPSMNVSISDLKIMNCLLSDARMEIVNIAKKTSISNRTVTRRLERMQQNHVITDFRVMRNMSSMNLTGYIEFLLIVYVNNKSAHGEIVERMYREMQEYLIYVPLNISGSEVIIALFFCSNIPTVDSITRRVKSYDGLQDVKLFITTQVKHYEDWLVRQINKKITSYSTKTKPSKIRLYAARK
ncbi:MAG TPA: winged helix-turn-helix transcriptional regulator [Candidatus Nitrosocosmicus sp.]